VHKRTDAVYRRALSLWGSEKEIIVLGTLIIILLVLWLLGIVTSFTLGGFIHILLVVAIVVILVRVIQGRNPLQG
jgi:hypothetical protein